jgi:hypothetical protein
MRLPWGAHPLGDITMAEAEGPVSLTTACHYQYGDDAYPWLVPSSATPANWIKCVRSGTVLGGLNYNEACYTGQATNDYLNAAWDGSPYWIDWRCL